MQDARSGDMPRVPVDDPLGCFAGRPVVLPGKPDGISVAVKDNIDVAGLPTGAGLGRPGPVAAHDAPVVHLLRQAGVTLIGKTRMNEAALGATGDNPHWGRTGNPRAPGHSPGGSSSGSAAAVAAGYCDAALGTDTLGSVRIPASYCGVVGLKPTRGLVPTAGVVPLSWTLDHVGILAASAGMVARVLALVVGAPPHRTWHPPRLGVPDALDDIAIEPQTGAIFRNTLDRLRDAGWVVERCHVPNWVPDATRRAGLLLLEAEGAVVHEALVATDDPALSADVRRLLQFGRDCGSGRLVRALRLLRDVAQGMDDVLRSYDFLAMPTVPSPAFAWGDKVPVNQADLAASANFGGMPAISVPVDSTADGLPVGLQLIGRCGSDWDLLDAANVVGGLPA